MLLFKISHGWRTFAWHGMARNNAFPARMRQLLNLAASRTTSDCKPEIDSQQARSSVLCHLLITFGTERSPGTRGGTASRLELGASYVAPKHSSPAGTVMQSPNRATHCGFQRRS